MGLLDRLFDRGGDEPPEGSPEAAVDPRAVVEAALEAARVGVRSLRNETARAVAKQNVVRAELDAAADEVGEARALATEALRKAAAGGDPAEVERWERTARSVAARLVAAEDRAEALRPRDDGAADAVDRAREAEAEGQRALAEVERRRSAVVAGLDEVRAGHVGTDVDRQRAGAEERLERAEAHVERRVAEARARADLSALEDGDDLVEPVDERAERALAALRSELAGGAA